MPGPLPALANALELAKLTGRSAADTQLLASLVEASRRFRLAVGHPVSLVTADVLEVDGKGGAQFRLAPPLPIIAITQITVDDVIVDPTDYRVNKRNGIVTRRSGCWPYPPAAIEVTYTHGYEVTVPDGSNGWPADGPLIGLPETIQSVVLEQARLIMNTDPGITSKTVLGDSTTFGGAAVGTTQAWTDAVLEYRQRTGDEA